MSYLEELKQAKIAYTPEDLQDYDGVSAIIYDRSGKQILMQDHVKQSFWTIPVGKVKKGQSIVKGLLEEVWEECGIKLLDYEEIYTFQKTYARHGRRIKTVGHIFEVHKYSGTPRNLEPKKHRKQIFIPIKKIKRLGRISDMTINAMKVKGWK